MCSKSEPLLQLLYHYNNKKMLLKVTLYLIKLLARVKEVNTSAKSYITLGTILIVNQYN